MSIVLIGFKNSGKTSIGKMIAQRTCIKFIDTDELIEHKYFSEEKQSLSVREIYRSMGADYFRALEKLIISEIATVLFPFVLRRHTECVVSKNERENTNDNTQSDIILATGGGSVLNDENVSHLKTIGKIIHLYTSANTLLNRIKTQPTTPAFLDEENLNLNDNFNKIYQLRLKRYQQIADIEVSTDNKSVSMVATEIITKTRGA